MRSIKGQEEYVGQSNAYISIYKRRLQAASLSSYAPFPTTLVCACLCTSSVLQCTDPNLSVICQLAPIRLGYMCHLGLTFICIQSPLLWLFNTFVINDLISARKIIQAWSIYELHSPNENVEATLIHSTLPEASGLRRSMYCVYCDLFILHKCTMHLSSTSCISRISSILHADLGKLQCIDGWSASENSWSIGCKLGSVLQNISCIFELFLNFLGYPKHPN